jgi:integrase
MARFGRVATGCHPLPLFAVPRMLSTPTAHLWGRGMARKAFDDKTVAAFKTNKPQAEHFDGLVPGLALRLTKAGRKSWCFHYTSPATQKTARITLGTYPALSLKVARDLAITNKGKVEKGIDPRDDATSPDKTVAELIEDRLRLKVRPDIDPKTNKVIRQGLKSAREIERRYKKNIVPLVGKVLVKDFRITHLHKAVDPLIAAHKPRMAAMVFHDLQALFNFAVSRGELEYNPLAKADMAGSTGNERERYLTLAEIKKLWNSLPQALSQSDYVPAILKLCLILGQRVGEVSGMAKSELDLKQRIWTIPGNRTKNGDDHVVPLHDLAIGIITPAIKKAKGDYLFPNDKGQRFDRNAVTRAVGRANEPTEDFPLGRFGIPHWTPHDLRRTVSTHMSLDDNGLQIPELHIGHVLNHRTQTRRTITQRVYNKNLYLKEKREALKKWADFLKKVIGAHPKGAA